jgi:hypothetical protein
VFVAFCCALHHLGELSLTVLLLADLFGKLLAVLGMCLALFSNVRKVLGERLTQLTGHGLEFIGHVVVVVGGGFQMGAEVTGGLRIWALSDGVTPGWK